MDSEYPQGREGAPAGARTRTWRRTVVIAGVAAAAVVAGGLAFGREVLRRGDPVLVLPKAIRDSMDAVFAASNEHWNELGDLNTLERMLGTVRPTQREYLGCLQGSLRGGTVRIDGWAPATDMKRLQLAVTGSCEGVPRLVGTWHTHPFRADVENRPLKERTLSAQDLQTFEASGYPASVVIWDTDSLDAAVRLPDGSVRHPAILRIE